VEQLRQFASAGVEVVDEVGEEGHGVGNRPIARPSFRRRPESSFDMACAALNIRVLCPSDAYLDWIPAFAGMTMG
jgi:hypothetical protein